MSKEMRLDSVTSRIVVYVQPDVLVEMKKMPELTSPSQIRRILEERGIHLKHHFGQNFLVDAHYVDRIIDAAEIEADDVVVEIGPGLGVLTSRMAKKAKKVIAIEVDPDMVEALDVILEEYPNVAVINQDVLKVDWPALLSEHDITTFKVITNLPYYITTPVLTMLFESYLPISLAVVMVQREVGARMVAEPGTKDYGSFSIFIQYYSTPHLVTIVPPTVFMPPPKVDSAVLRLDVLGHEVPFQLRSEDVFFQTIKAAFGQRRKMLRKALQSLPYREIDPAVITQCLEAVDVDPTRRGETLTMEEFARLSNAIADHLA